MTTIGEPSFSPEAFSGVLHQYVSHFRSLVEECIRLKTFHFAACQIK